MDARRRSIGPNRVVGRAPIHFRRRECRIGTRRPSRFESAEAHVADPDVGLTLVRNREFHCQRLTRGHDPVIRQSFDTKAMSQHGRSLELLLLEGKAMIDLPNRGVAHRERPELRSKGADRLESHEHSLSDAIAPAIHE